MAAARRPSKAGARVSAVAGVRVVVEVTEPVSGGGGVTASGAGVGIKGGGGGTLQTGQCLLRHAGELTSCASRSRRYLCRQVAGLLWVAGIGQC